ncbi:helix-turn-helix domain-containing protein [Streptomyces acidiscabies]|uniref:Helix-turn-helix transcriptional regulator n=1 Tax=Streptomyces acidiscabies TaxID=42234 RepID=A0AAP6EE17_9ACTN|nr:helix-turn-helix transcriptional regulator [Streptomyces acidiscabies]MBP5939382.1 helix-turn-helix domain-containing protein [Streptomyces sp. LBUM 1476]MBZ3910522.1 helix-turn-helix domain-containing protein [Streptomyces acidiscabies]MDX2959522.1 helix-turn-helix transcriptional regulator [Streptomyces acidiscabies]MDX3019190.1 helix-turn-helix transcriptional regulator [Streptomyces acidiscabies]MDX3790729.1 helix-turn-helix transcriptional regulator [Streptomyces acidiscabies]
MTERITTRRRQLGATMRKLRARKGFTLEEAGELVGVSKATVSRYETQAGPVKWLVIDALCREYGTTDVERKAIVALAKDAKQQGWWHSFADAIPESMDLLLTLEDDAVREDHFACVYVPGLLQTRAYSTALQSTHKVPLAPDEIERLVDIRMKRQEILLRPKPPRLWAILDESVIRRVVGSPQIMREQLGHLLEAAESPHITLQILPFAKGAHGAALGSFVLIGGLEPALDVVYVDLHTGSLFMEKDEELDHYKLAFEYLRAQAWDMEASISMIHRAREEL